jgi:hypothetical protein
MRKPRTPSGDLAACACLLRPPLLRQAMLQQIVFIAAEAIRGGHRFVDKKVA